MAFTVGVMGGTVSTIIVLIVESELMFPAASRADAVYEWLPSFKDDNAKDQFPPVAVTDPTVVLPSLRVTTDADSAVPDTVNDEEAL